MLPKVDELDKSKSYSIKFNADLYLFKMKDEFDYFIEQASKIWEDVKIEYYNGSTIPCNRILLLHTESPTTE